MRPQYHSPASSQELFLALVAMFTCAYKISLLALSNTKARYNPGGIFSVTLKLKYFVVTLGRVIPWVRGLAFHFRLTHSMTGRSAFANVAATIRGNTTVASAYTCSDISKRISGVSNDVL